MVTTVNDVRAPADVESATIFAAKQGNLALLDHSVAQELLQSRIPARLAYTALDGTPRVIPAVFLWTGAEIVLGSWPDDPKVWRHCASARTWR
jgi:hypothetical protein